MLSKAQEDFNKSERPVVPPQQLSHSFAGMQLNNNPPSQQQAQHQSLMKQMPDITSPNVVNFFAAAQQPNGKPDGGQNIQSQNKQFIVANHSKAPPVQTLDEIEKQHRVSASPPQSKVGKIKNETFNLVKIKLKSKCLKLLEHKSNFNNLLNSVAQQQQHQSISPQPQPVVKLQQPGAFQISNKPALITPAMFQASKIEEKAVGNAQLPAHIQSHVRPEPLTQNQLLQALNYLMETDPEFIRKVHEAYIKIVSL